MADNVAITAGAGTTIAADEATYSGDTSKIQLMKPVLVTGSEGSKTVVELIGDTTGRLQVINQKDMIKVSVQSSGLTTATTSYSAGDTVGSIFTIANAGRVTGGSGMIVGCALVDAADVTGPYDVVFFSTSVTLGSDNAAFSISDSDALNIIGIASMSGSYDFGGNRLNQLWNLAIPYVCESGATSIYAGLITRANHSFFSAVTDLQLITYLERN